MATPCDLVILDVMMPGTDGFILSSQIRQRSNVPIIIVSARDSEMDKITGISLGSDDYMTKPFSPMELVARVKAIFRRLHLDNGEGENENERNATAFGNIEAEQMSRDFKIDGKKVDLTPTEFTLITYFINNHSRAISREELLKNVWKFDFDADTRATDDVIKRLRKKLAQAGSTVRIESVWGFGFKLEATEQ
jgi:DNA-binding response OmpR family regulator